ncbi:MAG: ImmA/IrrE family metallo-endopeptidase [Verrucomicrobiae bacterium]|nr:ImmA/IrrE family metallo-endopeptidase [Verrucomicrobiae bacterium]
MAFEAGGLLIEEGGLESAEGRLLANGKQTGVIRVRAGMALPRRRFTVAHEIGHRSLHSKGVINHTDSPKTLAIWNDRGEEAEANTFAAELLLPTEMVLPRFTGHEPSIALIEAVASEFRTSRLSTAIQYIRCTNEVVALVVSHGWDIEWSQRTKDFLPRIRTGRVSKDSAAGERLARIRPDSGRMVVTPAYAWLEGFDQNSNKDLKEDSVYLDYYDRTVTLLWLEDDISD